MTVIALLRGVNVGGNRMVPMASLRRMLEELGMRNVRTLLQSGNAVFESRSMKGLGAKIEAALEKNLGFRPAVVLRTPEELAAAIAANPFAAREDVRPGYLIVTFFAGDPKPLTIDIAPEEVHIVGREMYVHYPEGMGRSKFPAAAVEKQLGVTGTARNWNTVLKLAALASGPPV